MCLARVKPEDDNEDKQPGVMKPDIVFFGEGLPASFHSQLQKDKAEVLHHVMSCVIINCTGRPVDSDGLIS